MSAIETITRQDTQTTMRVKSIRIEKLFEIFDYDIEYADGENVLILTGPNGFGKTTILNVLYSLFNRKFYFFYTLVFDRIVIELSDGDSIEIIKNVNQKEEVSKLLFLFHTKDEALISYDYKGDFDRMIEQIDKSSFLLPVGELEWMHRRDGNKFNLEDIANQNPGTPIILFSLPDKAKAIIDKIGIYLIKEQRLFENIKHFRKEERLASILAYADSLKLSIEKDILKFNFVSQNIDSTYPNRLISEKRKITKEEYDERFTNLRAKQNKLIKYGLYEKQATLEYSEDDAKALFVYLNDLEKKLSAFDELLAKLDLFTEILNKRRFTFKSIKITREKGFYFETTKGKALKMNELSSGERHQVILLYELIFNTTPNTLVLVDEPEISLHITWQKEFVRDLLRIIELQNFQVMIATHAPAIVNGRWDLVHNLTTDI